MKMQMKMANEPERDSDLNSDERRVAVPVDVQVHLAESRRALAEVRYELSVRRGLGWNVHLEKQTEHNA